MAWRRPTEDDFLATLEEREADVFARNLEADRAPIGQQMGYCCYCQQPKAQGGALR